MIIIMMKSHLHVFISGLFNIPSGKTIYITILKRESAVTMEIRTAPKELCNVLPLPQSIANAVFESVSIHSQTTYIFEYFTINFKYI